MFQPNSRIDKFKGIRFYEQDILFDDYTYNNDIQIVMDIDYMSPGIGIALMNNEGLPLSAQKDVYLFKLGFRESSIIFRDVNVTKKLMGSAITLVPPLEHTQFTFTKTGRRVSVSVEGYGKLIDYILPIDIDKYSIGIYSNAGNIIKSMSIASSIPDYWNVNMRNTNGGYLRFLKSGFTLENCKNSAEIEQPNITLEAGEYFLRYTAEGETDIKCYVMMSGDDRLHDEEKNILDSNGRFVLDSAKKVNLKFKGKTGTIKNVHLVDRVDGKYVATKDAQATIEGSYIYVNTKDLSKVTWIGTITAAAINTDPNDVESSIIVSGYESISCGIEGVLFFQEYNYEYDVMLNKLFIRKGNQLIYEHPFAYTTDGVTIFKNMDAVINQFSLIRENGEVINLIVEKTSKKYIPASITSPIIVVDDENIPLDLSSSYRVVGIGDNARYYFTNYEREIFSPSTHIKLEKNMSLNPGSIKIYGIPQGAIVNYENILSIPEAGMDTITLFCSNAVPIKEQDLHYLDKASGEVFFSDVSQYQLIVIDYLKKNSYCINYIEDMKMYEVDISTEAANTSLIYDHSFETYDDKLVTQIKNYRMTDITPVEKNYIVLRREGF